MCFVWSGVLVKWFMRLQENKLIIISISYFMSGTKEWTETKKWNINTQEWEVSKLERVHQNEVTCSTETKQPKKYMLFFLLFECSFRLFWLITKMWFLCAKWKTTKISDTKQYKRSQKPTNNNHKKVIDIKIQTR